jgi:hypothetical protein
VLLLHKLRECRISQMLVARLRRIERLAAMLAVPEGPCLRVGGGQGGCKRVHRWWPESERRDLGSADG